MTCEYEKECKLKRLRILEDENLKQRMYIAKLQNIIEKKFEEENITDTAVSYLNDEITRLRKENKRLNIKIFDLEQDNQIKNAHYFEMKKLEYQRKYNKCKQALEEIITMINTKLENQKLCDIYEIAKHAVNSVNTEDF